MHERQLGTRKRVNDPPRLHDDAGAWVHRAHATDNVETGLWKLREASSPRREHEDGHGRGLSQTTDEAAEGGTLDCRAGTRCQQEVHIRLASPLPNHGGRIRTAQDHALEINV